ncbi:MAG: 2-hydroxyacyl-CoA dehydratase [Firmicutes bacterium]|nr:2-hydroxyacyl-CoA dehydratase [Bacillota bacterium]
MRPNALEAFNELRDQNILNLKGAKAAGKKVVGIYCSYCPKELVLAAGAVPVSLCGTREEPIAAAEKHLPRNLCPLIKSSYGFAVTDTCPYFHFSDMIVGETTCDGKKKMFELMQDIKPVHVMHLPQVADREASLKLWHSELVRLQDELEERLGIKITDQDLREAIHISSEQRRARMELFNLNQGRAALISGTEMLTVSWQVGFCVDQQEGIDLIDGLTAELRELAGMGYRVSDESSPRILLTGTPVGLGSEKVITLVEELGGLVVAMQNCGGYNIADLEIDASDTRDPLLLLAENYLKIPCSVMSPNQRRLKLLERMIKEFQIDGVIDLTWQACHTFNVESFLVADLVKNRMGIPFLQIETDYSSSDKENLRVRIEAFLEITSDNNR